MSSWNSGAQSHDVVYNGWKANTGDYTYLKAAGNSTSAHGVIVAADLGTYLGTTNLETGAINDNATAPIDNTWAYFRDATAYIKGNTGIGVAPTTVTGLSIKSQSVSSQQSAIDIIQNGGTNSIIRMGEKSTDGARFHMFDGGTEKIAFYTDGTANHISAGNLGLGTASPSEKLHIQGSNNGNVKALIENTNTGSNAYATLGFQSNQNHSVQPALFLNGSNNTNYAGANSLNMYQYGNFPLGFVTNNTIRMTVAGDGKVGIGVNSPTAPLHVATSGATNALKLYQATYQQFEFKYDDTYHSTMMFGHFGELQYDGNGGYLRLSNNSTQSGSHIAVSTAGSERIRVTHDGKVGISESSPEYKLDVNAGTTNVVAKFKSNDNQAWISVQDDDSGTYGALYGTDSDAGEDIVIANRSATKRFSIDSNGLTKLHAYGSGNRTGTAAYNLQVDSSGNIIET